MFYFTPLIYKEAGLPFQDSINELKQKEANNPPNTQAVQLQATVPMFGERAQNMVEGQDPSYRGYVLGQAIGRPALGALGGAAIGGTVGALASDKKNRVRNAMLLALLGGGVGGVAGGLIGGVKSPQQFKNSQNS